MFKKDIRMFAKEADHLLWNEMKSNYNIISMARIT